MTHTPETPRFFDEPNGAVARQNEPLREPPLNVLFADRETEALGHEFTSAQWNGEADYPPEEKPETMSDTILGAINDERLGRRQ